MKNKLIFIFLLCVQFATARQINVEDYGVVPGQDATYALLQLIESVRDESNVTLVFPKGQYEFYPENAYEEYRAVSNHDNSLKRMAFPLLGCKDMTIDGGDSIFMFHGRIVPFILERVDGVTLKNFSIDWKRGFHDELLVVDRNVEESSITVEIDPELYPVSIVDGQLRSMRYNWNDPMGTNITFDPQTRSPIHDTRQYNVNAKSHRATKVGENRYKIKANMKTPAPIGSVVITYGVHPTSRLANAIHVTNSKDVRFENVTVYEAGGMALIVERTENIYLDHFVVTSNDKRLVSTRADATHFIGCKGTIQLENCLLEHMLDDGINVHGAYVKVAEVLDDNQLICEISHFQQWGLLFAEKGDKIAILSRETVLPFFETSVTDFRILNEHRFVVTLKDMPENLPEGSLSLENLTWYPDLIMRNNIIRENRARSILVTTKGKVVIENNYFNSQMNGILIEGDNKWWYESGAVEDVVIRNNTFVNSGFGADSNYYPLFASPMFMPEQRMGEGHYHRNIRFENNTLKSFDGRVAFARSVQGLSIKNNVIELSKDYPTKLDLPSIELDYCDDVIIEGNKVKGFELPLKVKQASDCSNIIVKQNSGYEK